MSVTSSVYNELKHNVKFRLPEYIIHHLAIPVSGRKKFPCPNPSHADRCPSCVIYDNSNGPIVKCFSCGLHCDIFELYSILTGAPLSGPEFYSENLVPLAKLLGLEIPTREMSVKDKYFDDVRRAYASAEKLVVSGRPSPEASQKLAKYGWSQETLNHLGIGSVNYEQFVAGLTGYGYDKMFLKKIGLLEPRLIGDHNLTYTMKDEHGQAIGFSSRNLYYEEADADYKAAVKQFGPGSPQALREKTAMPQKYFNTIQGHEGRDGSPILWKGKRLMGFHRARMGGAPLFLVEGNADVATAQNSGIRNCSGFGSAGFTNDHLELILRYQIPHVVLCLDADEGGAKGIKTFVDVLDRQKPPSWFYAEIMFLPPPEDPDSFISRFGPQAFLNLPRVDVFTWKVDQLVRSVASKQDLYNRVLQLMMDQQSPLRRFQMATIAGQFLQLPAVTLYDETFSRSGQPPAPVVQFTEKNGVFIPDFPIENISSKPIKLIDCRATITLSAGEVQPDLTDDLIYYPVRTR